MINIEINIAVKMVFLTVSTPVATQFVVTLHNVVITGKYYNKENIGSSGGRVVTLMACGTRGRGFGSRPCHFNFQRLVISCFQVVIWLKYC